MANEKIGYRLFCALLILFILEIAALPVVIGVTYATASEKPEHIITYTSGEPGRLMWDSKTQVDDNGGALLSLFDSAYENVDGSGDKVIAPGTERQSLIRLFNSAKNTVEYTAVLYSAGSTDDIPASASLTGEWLTDTDKADLPGGIAGDRVIRAVTGTLDGGRMEQFDISWQWDFERDGGDATDTSLGDKSAAGDPDDMTLGFYIVVRDNGVSVDPEAPVMGRYMPVAICVAALVVSGTLLLVLMIIGRNERKKHSS